jgi:hypothetical protein
MIPCLYQHELDLPIDHVKGMLQERIQRRGRPYDPKALSRIVRKECREVIAREALNPSSTMVEHLAMWTDFAIAGGDFPELCYFEGLAKGHPDLKSRWPRELEAGRMLAAYCHTAVQSICADLQGCG